MPTRRPHKQVFHLALISQGAMTSPPMGAAPSADSLGMDVDAAQPEPESAQGALVPAEDAILRAVKDGTGQFKPPTDKFTPPELDDICKQMHHYLKKSFRYFRGLHTGFPVDITTAYEAVMSAPSLHGKNISREYFIHVAYKFCSKKAEEFRIGEEPNEANNGHFTVMAIDGWDERNKVNRMLLANNIAAKECLLLMAKENLANIKLSTAVLRFDRKRKLECSASKEKWEDWITNLDHFPSLFECKDLGVIPTEDIPCDYLITCKQMDALLKVADANCDYKDWMVNSDFGLDDDGKPLDVQAIQNSSWPAPRPTDGHPPADSSSAPPLGVAAPSEPAVAQPMQDSVPSSGKGPQQSDQAWDASNWVDYAGAGSKNWGRKGTDGKSWAAAWPSGSQHR